MKIQHGGKNTKIMKEKSPINAVADLFLDAGATYQKSEEMLRAALLRRALQRTDGNISHAAALVSMHRNHFTRELELLQLRELPKQIRQAKRTAGEQLPLWRRKGQQRSTQQRSKRAA